MGIHILMIYLGSFHMEFIWNALYVDWRKYFKKVSHDFTFLELSESFWYLSPMPSYNMLKPYWLFQKNVCMATIICQQHSLFLLEIFNHILIIIFFHFVQEALKQYVGRYTTYLIRYFFPLTPYREWNDNIGLKK